MTDFNTIAKISSTIEIDRIDETLNKLRGFSDSVDETQKKMDEISRKPAKVNVQVDGADKVDGAMQSLLAYGTVAATAFQLVRSAVDFTKHAVALAGAAEKTGEYATATKGLTDEIDQLSIAIGNGLLPQLTEMKTKAIPIISDLVDMQERLNETNKKATVPAWLKAIPIVGGSIVVAQVATHKFGNSTEEAGEKARNAAADLHHWSEAAVEANERAREMALTSEMIAINLSAQEGGDLWNQAAQDLQAYKDEMDGAQVKARDMAVAQSELAEALKWANNAQLAKVALDDLKQSFEEGKITGDEYKEASNNLMLSFGIATPASIALAENTRNITKAYEDGILTAEQMDEAIRNMNKDAQDGNVDIASVLESAGAPAESVNLFVEGLENAKKATDDLVNTEGSVSESAGFVDEAMQVLAERYVVHGGETDILKGKVSALSEMYATLEKNILNVLAAQKKVNMTVGTNTGGNFDRTPFNTASGADFIVPPGYPHDSYRMNVQSGERVIVIPANERASGGGGSGSFAVYGNLIIQTAGVSPADVISQLSVT